MIIPIVLNHLFVLANTHQVIVDDVNTGKRTTKFHLRLAERQVQGKLIYFIFCVDAVVGGVLSLSVGGRILRIYTYSARLLNSSLCIIQNYKSPLCHFPLPLLKILTIEFVTHVIVITIVIVIVIINFVIP